MQNDSEFRMLFKTTAAQYDAVERAIRELHSYELPAIHALALEAVFAPYGEWIERHSAGQPLPPAGARA